MLRLCKWMALLVFSQAGANHMDYLRIQALPNLVVPAYVLPRTMNPFDVNRFSQKQVMSIQGLFYKKTGARVQLKIGGQASGWVSEGDQVEGYQVTSISEKTVWLDAIDEGGDQLVLHVSPKLRVGQMQPTLFMRRFSEP